MNNNNFEYKSNESEILVISAVFPPEPVVSANLSRDIANELAKKNKVVVLCPQPTRPAGFKFKKNNESSNYKIIKLNSYTCPNSVLFGRFRESFSFGKHCVKYIKANMSEISCIYLNSWPLFSQYLIVKIAKKYKINCVIHVQDIYPESLTNKLPYPVNRLAFFLFLQIDKYVLRNVNKIICISQNMIDYLSKSRKIEINNFELVRNWQDDESFLELIPSHNETNKFVFMYLGSISPSAGVDTIIISFHLAKLADAKLIIAGNGSEREKCKEIVNKIKNKNIEFCDVSFDKVPKLQSKADVLLLPLKRGIAITATPSKLTAYLLSAKPIIACVEKDSDVSNIINQADCGYVVNPEDIDDLAFVMKQVYTTNRNKLKELGLNGRKYAISYLSKNINLNKIVTIIKNQI